MKPRVVGGMVWEVGGVPADAEGRCWWRVMDVRAQRGWVRGRATAPERARGGGMDGEWVWGEERSVFGVGDEVRLRDGARGWEAWRRSAHGGYAGCAL